MMSVQQAIGRSESPLVDGRPLTPSRLALPWPWICAAVGIGAGLIDFGVMWYFGADMTIGGTDVTLLISLAFVTSFAALGWLVGGLMRARLQAAADAQTIAAQLRELERAQREVVQQEKLAAIGRLAAGVAHEVRNPLGVIRASASMVQESFTSGEDPYRACEFICEEIDRLNALITGLLSFARPTQLALASTSIDKVIDCALQLAHSEMRARAIEVERSSELTDGFLQADPDLLAQVVYGLVLNASQAVEREGRIAIRVRSDEMALELDVADDGPGIAPELGDQVFEPFVTTKATGTGLGLAMARRIIESHGGALTQIAGRGLGPGGGGACFRIQLPHPASPTSGSARERA